MNHLEHLRDEYKNLIVIYKQAHEVEARSKKGGFGDTIYMGMFTKTLKQDYGYTKSFLKKAQQKGILKKSYVAPDKQNTNERRSIYLLLTEKLPQRTKFKKFIVGIFKFFKK